MITPRTTRLIRVPDLKAMHRAIAARAGGRAAARACAIIVPTRGAGQELRRTLENLLLVEPGLSGSDVPAATPSKAAIFPDLLTRADFYVRVHERLNGLRPLLTDFEREVILRRAAVSAGERGAPAPFRLRAGLVVEILAFYDELRRCHKTVADFARLIGGSLEPSAAIDRGAERMLRQTRFLAAAFEDFEAAARNRVWRSMRSAPRWIPALAPGFPMRPCEISDPLLVAAPELVNARISTTRPARKQRVRHARRHSPRPS